MERKLFSSGAKWESIAGYSRAIRVGNVIEVAGTVAVDEFNEVVGKDNVYVQTTYILQKIQNVLREAGADMKDVVRTRYTERIERIRKKNVILLESISECLPRTFPNSMIFPEHTEQYSEISDRCVH